jgi:hypothetical protein
MQLFHSVALLDIVDPASLNDDRKWHILSHDLAQASLAEASTGPAIAMQLPKLPRNSQRHGGSVRVSVRAWAFSG